MKHQLLFAIIELFAVFGIFRCGGSIFLCRVLRDTIILVNNLLYSLFRRAEDIYNLFKEFVVHIFDVVDAKLLCNLSLFERQVEIEICYHNYKPIKLLFSSAYFGRLLPSVCKVEKRILKSAKKNGKSLFFNISTTQKWVEMLKFGDLWIKNSFFGSVLFSLQEKENET